jgi:hypothetical protein
MLPRHACGEILLGVAMSRHPQMAAVLDVPVVLNLPFGSPPG